MKAAFTPGPWFVGNQHGFNINTIQDREGDGICNVFGVPMHTHAKELPALGDKWANGLANARLIAAAPELYEALLPFGEPHAMGDNYVSFAPRLIEAARAALAKARGGTL